MNKKSRPGRISRGTLMFTTMSSFFIILCLCSLLLVKLQVPDASLVVFLVTELLAAMPNQNIANNAEVEVWFVQPELNSLEPNFFLIPTEDGQKRSGVESGPPTKKLVTQAPRVMLDGQSATPESDNNDHYAL